MRRKEGRKKQARSNKQQGKATHVHGNTCARWYVCASHDPLQAMVCPNNYDCRYAILHVLLFIHVHIFFYVYLPSECKWIHCFVLE